MLGGDGGYTRISAGVFAPAGDIDQLDDGFYGQIAFGTDLTRFFAADISVGYLRAEGASNRELWAIPVFLNGRFNVPLLVFELYGGIGVGGMYSDLQLGSAQAQDFLLAGTAFAGLEVGLGNLSIGAEYRYLTTEDTGIGAAIEGHSALLTLTLPF